MDKTQEHLPGQTEVQGFFLLFYHQKQLIMTQTRFGPNSAAPAVERFISFVHHKFVLHKKMK